MKSLKESPGIQVSFLPLLLVAFSCANPGIARASTIDVRTLTEVMIENETVASLDFGLDFGADPNSPIKFTSFVNVSTGQFSFATVSGSTYLGMPLTITGAGTFNSTTNVVATSQLTALGSASFTGTGTDTLNLSANPETDALVMVWSPVRQTNAPQKVKYNNSEEDNIYFPDGNSRSLGFLTLDDKAVSEDEDDFDFWDPATGEWSNFDDDPEFEIQLFSSGFSPTQGGAGTFTTTLVATPEPGSLQLVSLGFLCLSLFALSAKRRAAHLRKVT